MTVYLENWHTWVEPTIDDILLAAGQAGANTTEQWLLLEERNILAKMIQEVKNVAPEQRQSLHSPLLASYARDSLNIPRTIIERVGEIHHIYCRFRNRLEWPTKGKGIE